MNLLRSGIDTAVLFKIVRAIARPFTEWRAYKEGVIDERGNIIVPKKARTSEQYYSLTYFDIFVLNLKKLLQKIPGGNSKIATYAAALWLIREDRYETYQNLTEDGESIPANISSGEIARSDEKEAKSFKIIKRKKLDSLK